MNFKIATSIFSASFKTLGYLFLFLLLGLFLDSYYMAEIYSNTQILTNITVLIGFAILYLNSSLRVRKLMIYAAIIGAAGEYLFSIGLQMYTYRLGTVPLYVPLGHAIVYVSTIHFCKQPIIRVYRKQIEKYFTIAIVIYSSLFLIFADDVFGFVMSMAVIYLLRNKPRERLFFLSMYVAVVVLEIIGTSFQCWSWPDTSFGVIPFLPSANPPSGISLVYFLLDLGTLWVYKQCHKTAWARMKSVRQLRERLVFSPDQKTTKTAA